MKYLKITVVFIFIAFAVFACASKTSKRKEFNIAESKSYEASLFRQNCAICHGSEANGKEMEDRIVPSLRYGEAALRRDNQRQAVFSP